MTLPEDLVKVVVATLRQLDAERRWSRSRAGYEVDAEAIVAALLRALPGSDEVKRVVALELPVSLKAGDWNGYIADNILAAIAKLADDD